MFAKFTQKAIDVVQSAQNYALKFCHDEVLSQHLLLGLVFQTKGVQAKILNFDKINFGELIIEVQNSTSINPERLNGLNCKETQNINERQNQKSCKNCENQNCSNIQFSKSSKEILELALKLSNELNSKFVMPQHIALAILESKNSGAYKIFKKFNIDEEKIIPNLKKMLDKSSDIVNPHPENAVENTQLLNINDFFREKTISQILENAKSKLTTSGYEILGSEQLLQSILENKDYKITNILEQYNLTSEALTEKLKEFTTRSAEFENSEKQIIFTPNAFCALLLALDYAKESGSVGIEAEHVILGILKSKKGIAYKILSSMIGDFTTFEDIVLKSTNDKMPETLAILRLAKGYALELNSQTVGTEIILLGILSYGAGIAFNVLKGSE